MSPRPIGPAGPSGRRVRAVQAGLVAGVGAVWLAARRSPDALPTDELLTRATAQEVAADLPGDDLVHPAEVVMDRAFTLPAPPDEVWPWLVQLGKGRGGWYLPTAAERLVPPGWRGLRHLDDAYLRLRVGDVIPDWGGRDETFTVLELVPSSHLVHGSTRGRTRLTWCLHLTPLDDGRTRLHLRLRLAPVRHTTVAEQLGGLFDQVTVMGLAAGLRERLTAGTG